jgi:hypothetical protein
MGVLGSMRACLSYRHPFGAALPPDKGLEEFYLHARIENFLDAIDDDLRELGGDVRIFVRPLTYRSEVWSC